MGCGCNKGQASPMSAARGAAAGSAIYHYVYKAGQYTGRRFTSLLAARSYAERVDGETSTAAPGPDGSPEILVG